MTNCAFYCNELRNFPKDIVSGHQSHALTSYFECDLSLDLVCLEISALSYTLPFPHKGLKPITSTWLPNPLSLIFGVGPRTGTFIANKFAGAGYQVAATGCSVKDGPASDGYLNIKADLTDPAVVPDVFAKVKAHCGTHQMSSCTMVHSPTFPRRLLKIVSAK